MPFDVSGNFSRLYNFTQDRNNGIKILASRVDGEFDNVSAGLNQVLFRSGIVAMTGDLNMGLNRIIGLSDGAAGNPSTKFSSDPLSGFFLDGYGRPSISATGAKAAEFNQNGVILPRSLQAQTARATGDFTTGFTGAGAELGFANNAARFFGYNRSTATWLDTQVDGQNISLRTTNVERAYINANGFDVRVPLLQGGQQVWHAGNLNPANYVSSTGATFTGGVVAPTFTVTGAGGRFIANDRTSGASQAWEQYADGGVFRLFRGVDRFTVDGVGNAMLGGILTVAGGNVVWHAGNLNPGSYALLSGANFTGQLQQNGQQVYHTGNLNLSGYAQLSGANFSGALQQNGQQVYHAGNFNPSVYAQLSGATFTGAVSGPTFTATGSSGLVGFNDRTAGSSQAWSLYADAGSFRVFRGSDILTVGTSAITTPVPIYGTGANGGFKAGGDTNGGGSGPGAEVAWTGNNARLLGYNRSSNQYVPVELSGNPIIFSINGTQVAGISSAGNLSRTGAGNYAYDGMTRASARITDGTAAPSGGSDGDMYFQYT